MKTRLLGALFIAVIASAQNALLPPEIHKPFLTANGQPLNAGYIYTCIAGTTCSVPTVGGAPSNPQATYQDAGGTIANPNPVVLDYTGWAQIRLTCGSTYKIVAQDRLGNQQWTLDNVAASCGANGGIINATGVTGNFLIPGVLVTGQGPLIDVTAPAYGAVHDNIHDDTAHIQLAVNFAAISGGTVYFPCGTYLLSSNTGVIVNSTKVNLQGRNQGCVVLHYTGTGRALTIQMAPFTTNPAGDYRDFTIQGTSAASEGILSGQIVAGHFENITVTGFTGGSGIHLHNAGSFSTWTERNDFINVTLGGYGSVPTNKNGFLLDSDNTGDSFGYNRYLDIKFNTNTDQIGFNLDSGFMYNNKLTAIFNMDSTPAGTNGPIAIRSNGNWDSNFITVNGEAITTGSTGSTTYSGLVTSSGRFANLKGSNLNIFNSSSAQLSFNNQKGATTAQDVTLVEMSQISSWDTGSFTLNTVTTTPEPVQRANYGSVGMLIGNNIESPYVSMFQGTGNQFTVLTVPSGGNIGNNGVDVAHIDTFGNLGSPTYKTYCNSFYSGICIPVATIDGGVPVEVGAMTSAHRSGYNNLYFQSNSGINESMSGDPNFSGGIGYFIGTNLAHPLIWSYTLDPNNLEVFEKAFQTPLTSSNKVFGVQHGAIVQGSTVKNVAGTCSVSGSSSCTWSYSSAFNSKPICTATPEFDYGSTNRFWVTVTTTGCQVSFSTNETGTIDFHVVGNPN